MVGVGFGGAGALPSATSSVAPEARDGRHKATPGEPGPRILRRELGMVQTEPAP